jgi:hypothetical protein
VLHLKNGVKSTYSLLDVLLQTIYWKHSYSLSITLRATLYTIFAYVATGYW